MRIGVGVGPLYVSAGSSGRRYRRRWTGLSWWGLLLFAVLVFAPVLGGGAVWFLAVGIPVLVAAEMVHRRRARRR